MRGDTETLTIAIVQDHIVQRGGAERVLGLMMEALPGATVYTSFFDRSLTYPEIEADRIEPSAWNRSSFIARHHRWAFPLFPFIFGLRVIDADFVLCASAGWSHGVKVRGRKIVYMYAPARWLYQREEYLAKGGVLQQVIVAIYAPWLRRWDKKRLEEAHLVLTSSQAIAERIKVIYAREATVLPPPSTFEPEGKVEPLAGMDSGYFLCVSRLLPYKNVDRLVQAFSELPDRRLVVVGEGPLAGELRKQKSVNTEILAHVSESQLRWLYLNCEALIAPAIEDFGLTPIEAGLMGRPTLALRAGGYLDTVVEEKTGVFMDATNVEDFKRGVGRIESRQWHPDVIRDHYRIYDKNAFIESIRSLVEPS